VLVNGVRLVPDASGALWWPGERTLVVADLHLEKGSAYAAAGRSMLPPYDTRATVEKLAQLMRRYSPKRLIALGDSFHDGEAGGRLSGDDRARLLRLTSATEMIWIAGNHDPAPPANLGGVVMEVFSSGGLTFQHLPEGRTAGEVAGHLHPKASVVVRGRKVTRRCFVTDGAKLVLPAFGAFTGGLSVMDQAFVALFRRRFHAWMLGDGQVFPVPAARILGSEDEGAERGETSPAGTLHRN